MQSDFFFRVINIYKRKPINSINLRNKPSFSINAPTRRYTVRRGTFRAINFKRLRRRHAHDLEDKVLKGS